MCGLLRCAAAAAAVSLAAFAEGGAEIVSWHTGAEAGAHMPQGGLGRGAAAAGARLGAYLGDFTALEASFAWAPGECAGAGADVLWHLAGWSFYDNLFGCERFDPFLLFGAEWRSIGAEEAAGPMAGVGAYWHLTERLDLRVQATAAGACGRGMLYAACAGLQWNFGGGE